MLTVYAMVYCMGYGNCYKVSYSVRGTWSTIALCCGCSMCCAVCAVLYVLYGGCCMVYFWFAGGAVRDVLYGPMGRGTL